MPEEQRGDNEPSNLRPATVGHWDTTAQLYRDRGGQGFGPLGTNTILCPQGLGISAEGMQLTDATQQSFLHKQTDNTFNYINITQYFCIGRQ